jgi:putative iron-regulated protein
MMKQIAGALAIAACATALPVQAAVDERAVVETYANIALATYEDSLAGARALKVAVADLVAAPSAASLALARAAWLAAREPYMQSEVFRFGNPIVDDWEGKVNAWPLDEGLIDYVAQPYGSESAENPLSAANVIANPTIKHGADTLDASVIDAALLSDTLHEIDDIEANVATGYHAIEFLLWGQDLNGTGAGAGDRPAADYDTTDCAHADCTRRAQYLVAATDLLVDDLRWMVEQWRDGGAARVNLTEGEPRDGIRVMLTGLGSLSYGELAGERMKLGLMLHDPEEEHDCFSDNTHNSHYFDVMGMGNVVNGHYRRSDGTVVTGPSLADLLGEHAPAARNDLLASLAESKLRMALLRQRAETHEAYDQMLAADNAEGNAVVQAAVDALLQQTKAIQRSVAALEIGSIALEGSDSLDKPEAVFQ